MGAGQRWRGAAIWAKLKNEDTRANRRLKAGSRAYPAQRQDSAREFGGRRPPCARRDLSPRLPGLPWRSAAERLFVRAMLGARAVHRAPLLRTLGRAVCAGFRGWPAVAAGAGRSSRVEPRSRRHALSGRPGARAGACAQIFGPGGLRGADGAVDGARRGRSAGGRRFAGAYSAASAAPVLAPVQSGGRPGRRDLESQRQAA